MQDFLVIGDVTTDHILTITDHQILASADKDKGTVVFPYPRKLPLSEAPRVTPGGNAYTVSIVLEKLGQQAGIYTVIGNDVDGTALHKNLEQHGVDCSLIQKDEMQGTNNSTILVIAGDRVIFSHHFPRDYHLPQLQDVKRVYLTSIGEDDAHLFRQVLEQKDRVGFELIFAPGSLQLREDYGDIKAVVEQAAMIILNKEEAQMLTHNNSASDEELLRLIVEKGPQRVIMTKSHRGAIAYDHGNIHRVGALQVQVVDTTGAGDTYAATVCAALAKGLDLITAMEYAAIHSAYVVCTVGCEEGILNLEDLQMRHAEQHGKLIYQD